MKKISLLLILTLLLTSLVLPASSQTKIIKLMKIGALTEQDRSVASNLGLYGGQANDVVIDTTSNRVYMTTVAPNGLFISNDNGINWNGLSDSVNYGIGHQVEVDSSGNVYVYIGNDLLKSTDGVNFTKITSNLGAAVSPDEYIYTGQGKLFVGIKGGIAISSDNGASFTKVTIESGATVRSIAASPTNGVFYLVTNQNNSSENLYISTNGGVSWSDFGFSAKTGVPASQRIGMINVNPVDANEIVISQTASVTPNSLISTNGGTSWSTLQRNSQDFGSNHITYDVDGRLHMNGYWTINDGSSWTQLTTTTPVSSLYSDVFAVDPANTSLILTNSDMGLARSTDRGVSWSDAISGVTSVKTYDITQANNKQYVWIGANGGLARSSNFTSSSPDWNYPILSGGQASTVYAVWVNPINPNIVVSSNYSSIYRTENAQAANPNDIIWSQVASITSGSQISEIVSLSSGSDILYASYWHDNRSGTDTGGVLKSTDGGKTWSDLNITGNAPVTALSLAKDGNIYAGTGGDSSTGIYKYSGSTWTKLSGGLPDDTISSVLADPENSNNILATTGIAIYRSTDGGASWTKITNGISKLISFDSLTVQTSTSPNTFYMAAQDPTNNYNGVIYKSADGGLSWGEYYVGLKQEQFYGMLFDGLTAGNDRGLFEIKSKASVGLTANQRIVKKVKKKGKIRNKVTYKKIKTAKKGQVVSLKIALSDKSTKKKLKNRTAIVYKRAIVKKKVKGKWKKVAIWKKVKKAKVNKYGYVYISTKLSATSTYYALWKPSNKYDKEEYTSSKSKSLTIKVTKAKKKK